MEEIRFVYGPALNQNTSVFEPNSLLSVAEAATGLFDWGGKRWAEARFRERLAAFCHDLETAAALTPLGRSRAHSRLHVLLCSRLRQVRNLDGKATEVLSAPIVGTGLPRAGTTFLHGLLAAEKENLTATAAQAAIPVPSPGSDWDEAIRTEFYEQVLTFQGFTAPDVTEIHPYAAELPEECVFMQEAACGSPLGAFFYAPTFGALCVAPDHIDDGYAWQRGMMTSLQTYRPEARRWLLKTPLHISRIGTLNKHFPGARIFFNHRDPGKVIPSMASLYMKLYGLSSNSSIDPLALGPRLVTIWKRMLKDFDTWRDAHPEVRMFDVQYSELIVDPIGQAERLYEFFGVPLTSATKQTMKNHLQRDRHGKGPLRQYKLEDFGLSEFDIEESFADYINRHKVRREKRL